VEEDMEEGVEEGEEEGVEEGGICSEVGVLVEFKSMSTSNILNVLHLS